MQKLKTVRDSLLNAHSEKIIDDKELLLLFDVNCSTNLDLPYWSYESFDLDSWSQDECKRELRFFPGNIKNLVNILRLTDVFTCNNGVVCDSVEAFRIFVKHFAYPCRYQDIIYKFARPVPSLCIALNAMLDWTFCLTTGVIF